MEKRPTILSAFFTIFRPLLILAALMTYVLGLGIAHHLLIPIDVSNASLGFVLFFFLLEMKAFLEAYSRHPAAPENRVSNSIKVDDPYLSAVELFSRQMLLYVAVVFLLAGALLTTLLALKGAMPPAVYVVLAFAFLASYLASAQPVLLSEKGYGDVIEALLIANAAPAIALGMQLHDLHVLLLLLTLPLTLIALALRITIDLQDYGRDSLRNRQSMLVRIGWQRGMNLHNLSLIGAYLMIAAFAAFRLPWSLVWPQLLSLPVAIFQIFQMLQIASGAKPNWRLLIWTARATFALSVYMIALTLWIR